MGGPTPPQQGPAAGRRRQRHLSSALVDSELTGRMPAGVGVPARSGPRSPRRTTAASISGEAAPGSTHTNLVELRGLEPLTPTLPVWCATSCATAPDCA